MQLKLILRLDKGTAVFYRDLGLENESVLPQEELSVMIDLKLPEKSGKYSVTFRLVYGDQVEFGDEVTVNLNVDPKPEIACNTAMEEATLATHEQQLNETSACSVPVDEEANSEESCQSENEMDVSITSWDMVGDYGEIVNDCSLGQTPGIEDNTKGEKSVTPNESTKGQTL